MGRTGSLACLAALVALAACATRTDAADVAPRATTTTTVVPTSTTAPTTTVPATTTAAPTTTEAPTTTTTTVPVDVHALRPPAPTGEPAALAARIASAEATLRTPGAPAGDVAAAALTQQVAYRELGDHPEWDAAVLAALPADIVPGVQRQTAARREFMSLSSRPVESMPAWNVVAPAPPEQLLAWFQEAEAEFGIPWPYLAAINLVETGMGRIRGTSVAGAQGPMQFMPATWAAYGEGDVNDHRQAVRAAARYLQANGGPADMANALWHYNHSDHYVRGVELYAQAIGEHPGAWPAAYNWGVWYRTAAGDVFLPVGYATTERIPVDQYLATNPRTG
ncbi:MAG: lytic transglycosylase domain-containing protein [Acidimicrobiia bacterium]